jgi:hypothetical protein
MMDINLIELAEAMQLPHKKLPLIARTLKGKSDLGAAGKFLEMALSRFKPLLKNNDDADIAILWGAANIMAQCLIESKTNDMAIINEEIARRIDTLYLRIESHIENDFGEMTDAH